MNSFHTIQPLFIATDLFCGAGGATRGLIDAGGYVAAGVDIDAACKRTYESNNPNLTLDSAPPAFLAADARSPAAVAHLSARITRARTMAPHAPLGIAICAPCQPFTRIQRNGRISADKNESYIDSESLLLATLPHITTLKPDFIISENVSQLASPPNRRILDSFQTSLRALGYATAHKRVCASNFGVPQIRKRLILIAIRAPNAPITPLIPHANHKAQRLTAADAIDYLPPIAAGETHPEIPNHRSAALREISMQRLLSLAPGESNKAWATSPYGDIRPAFQRRRAWTDTFKNVGARISADKPAPAITTKFYNMMCGRFGHYSQTRALSLREGAALQGFPRDYVFYANSMQDAATMIGNAAPPPLMAHMAQVALQTALCSSEITARAKAS